VPYYNADFDEDGNPGEGGEVYESAEAVVPFVRVDAWISEIRRTLVELDYATLIVRYDGGCDEGFAYFHRAQRADGSAASPDEVAKQLLATPFAVHAEPKAGLHGLPQVGGAYVPDDCSPAERIGFLMDEFAHHAASKLLGEGYGTGEYTLRGWFRLELDSGRAVDLPEEP
jgi:hypothetical protein